MTACCNRMAVHGTARSKKVTGTGQVYRSKSNGVAASCSHMQPGFRGCRSTNGFPVFTDLVV